MPVVMLQMIAPVLEDVIAFVFDLPACPSGGDYGTDSLFSQLMIGGEGTVVEFFARDFIGDMHFTPVDMECLGRHS